MMKMNDRDSIECQNWEKKDIDDIFEILNDNRTKTQIVSSTTYGKGRGNVGRKKKRKDAGGFGSHFLVRESSFSLKIRAIRPSKFFGTRRRTALRGEGFAWVPDLGSFLKLQEVGVSPYLVFILCLSTM